MAKRADNRQWYKKKRWVFASLLIFPPLGIPLLWRTKWTRAGKIGGSILSSFVLLSVLFGESPEPASTSSTPVITEESSSVPESDLEPETVSAPPAYDRAIALSTTATTQLSSANTSEDWRRIVRDWDSALSALEEIPQNSNYFEQTQEKIEEYSQNYVYAVDQMEAARVAESAVAQQRQAEEQARQEQARQEQARREAEQISQAEEQEIQAFVAEEPSQGGFVSGTCKDLRERGIGSNFTPGDPNYTDKRDRDNDGVACES